MDASEIKDIQETERTDDTDTKDTKDIKGTKNTENEKSSDGSAKAPAAYAGDTLHTISRTDFSVHPSPLSEIFCAVLAVITATLIWLASAM